MNGVERVAGESADFQQSRRVRPEVEDASERLETAGGLRRMNTATSAGTRRGHGNGNRSRLGPGGRLEKIAEGSGPKRGQNYEVVARRVLEDGPERTVTISTWREEVARNTAAETEMSVYYVNADDYVGTERDGGTVGARDNSYAHRTRGTEQNRGQRPGNGRGDSTSLGEHCGKGVGRGKQVDRGRWSSAEVS